MRRTAPLLGPLLPCLLAAATAARPIDAGTADEVLAAASALRTSMLEGDHAHAVDVMHPRVREILGGRDAALQMTRDAWAQIAAQGMTLKEYEILRPTEVHSADAEDVVYLPTRMILDTALGEIASAGFLVASRPKGGGPWTFFDGAAVATDFSRLQGVIPGLPDDARPPGLTVGTDEVQVPVGQDGGPSAGTTPAWEAAHALAAESRATQRGAKYATKLGRDLADYVGTMDRICGRLHEAVPGWRMLVRVDADGSVGEVLVHPDGDHSQCHARRVSRQTLKKPPSAPFWIVVEPNG